MTGKEFQCPEESNDVSNCTWEKRSGCVRDFPKVGVEECSRCHLVIHTTDLREEVNYETGSMHEWSKGYGSTIDLPIDDIDRRMQEILKLHEECEITSILDFGSGRGEMLGTLSSRFDSYGYEPEMEARTDCQSRGLKVFQTWSEIESSNLKFDLVTMFHVIEHLYSPHDELRKIRNILKPGGLLLIETPNSRDALLCLYKSESFSNFTYWSHHPMLHSRDSLHMLLRSNAFRIHMSGSHQRYNLANHLYWLSEGSPGGHEIIGKYFSEKTHSEYAAYLNELDMNDTLWIVGIKD